MRFAVDIIQRLLQTWLFKRRAEDLSPWQVLGWWEARRLPYNLIVGATGLVSGAIILVSALVSEHLTNVPIGMPDPPVVALIGVVLYGIAANVCFTGGWIVELLVAKVWDVRAGAFGEISFFLGLIFSVLLTLLPAGLIVLLAILNLLGEVNFVKAPPD